MERAANKAARILQIEALLLGHPEGLIPVEIARRLGVHKSTISRCLGDLPKHIYVDDMDDGRWKIDWDAYLVNVRFSLHEAMAVHLATRLLAKWNNRRNPHAGAAARKLGVSLKKLAPFVSDHLIASAEVMDDEAQVYDPVYLGILEVLTRAWSQKRMVRLWHKQVISGRIFEYKFAPYFIEPYLAGQTTHVIGECEGDPPTKLRTFKLERIQQIKLLNDEPYIIPDNFNPRQLLANAWGIWYSEGAPEKVILKFTSRVAERVLETHWHQEKEPPARQPDGGLIWQVEIDEPQEMLPWIRGWGADCEVLEPEKLRRKLARETKRMAELYNTDLFTTGNFQDDPILPFASPTRHLWAKTDRHDDHEEKTHPLICHLIDVAQVVCALWDKGLPVATRRYFMETLGLNEATARRWLAFLAGLHDIGKATVVFQASCQEKYKQQVLAVLQNKGFSFPPRSAKAHPHGDMSTVILTELFSTQLGWDRSLARKIAAAVGGHHGAWPSNGTFISVKRSTDQLGQEIWEESRSGLFVALAKVIGIEDFTTLRLSQEKDILNTFCILLAGLTSFTDWMGSMDKDYFRFVASDENLGDYAEQAYAQARKALQELSWTNWTPPREIIPFPELFEGKTPRPLQEVVISMVEQKEPTPPALVIIEVPMGEGKTEAAWYLADSWLTLHQQQGIYVAMPTQATGNEMHKRVTKFIQRRYPGQAIAPLLLHGDALWNEEMYKLRFGEIGDDGKKTIGAYAWFLSNKKRSLLSPFGVGTVDQTLMAAMQTQHFFVRLFGLSHKTVIFDEVHAYDIYMNELFQRLLTWLAKMGTSVILLSATLPNKTRRQLIEAYTCHTFDKEVVYPAITWAAPGIEGEVIRVKSSTQSDIALHWLELDKLIEYLREAMREGGYVAIICNTVDHVQALYQILKDENLVPTEEDLIVFHARFPFYLRRKLESLVVNRFGQKRPAGQPDRAIVIATQVIEQSLDLDFDLMLTYLAPIDFILQRLGRLHRHERPRPAPLQAPKLTIFKPSLANDIPHFGNDEQIYSRYILLRSYLAISLTMQSGTKIAIPGQIQNLIEQVYGDELNEADLSDAWKETLQQAKEKQEKEELNLKAEARKRLVSSPTKDELMFESSYEMEDEDEGLQESLHYFTRSTRPSVTLVCLHQTDAVVTLDPEGKEIVDLNTPPEWETARRLAERKVTISNPTVVKHFRGKTYHAWKDHAILRHYYPLCFRDKRYLVSEKLTLIFDEKQGIIIQKEAK
jgi:CRISPR-associated endonuclease/helicase Cas3